MDLTGGAIGVHLEPGAVHLAEMRAQFGRIDLVRAASEDVTPASEGADPKPEDFAAALGRAWRKGGFSARRAHVSVAERDSMVRLFEMPLLPRREWRDSVRFEAQKYLPFDVRDLYCDFKVVPDRAKGRMRVAFAAVRRHTLDAANAALEGAGVKIASAEPESLSLLRLLFPQETKKSGEVFALLDVDPKGGLDIVLARDGSPLMTRHCPLASAGGPEARFQAFMGEVRLSFNYFAKNFKDESVRRIVLCADVEKDCPGWEQMLTQELELPVQVFNPSKAFGRPERYSSARAAAMGAALKSVAANAALKFNLVPSGGLRAAGEGAPLPPAQEQAVLKKVAVIEAGIVLALLIVLHLALGAAAGARQRGLAQLRQNLANQSGLGALPLEDLESRANAQSEKAAFLDQLVGKRVLFTDKLSEIARLTPGEVKLTLLQYADVEADKGGGRSEVSLSLEGLIAGGEEGAELTAINKFVSALKGSEAFMKGIGEVKISSVQRVAVDGGQRVKFTVVCSAAGKGSI